MRRDKELWSGTESRATIPDRDNSRLAGYVPFHRLSGYSRINPASCQSVRMGVDELNSD